MLPRLLTRPSGVSSTVVQLATRGTPTLAVEYVLAADPVGTVLLSHGYTGSKEDFWAVLPLLAARGLSAYAFDKRGQNQSPSEGPFTLDDYAADTAALSRALPGQDPDLPVHLLGHSWGGLEVARSVILHPDAYASVTLFCTGPAGHGPRPFNEPWLAALRTSSPAECWDQLAVRNAARGIPPAPPPESSFLRERFLAGNPRSLAAMTEVDLTLPDQIDALRESGVATLVVRGEDDRAWDPELQDDMARRLGTSVLVVPGGHTPNTDAPAEFVDAWLARLLRPDPSGSPR